MRKNNIRILVAAMICILVFISSALTVFADPPTGENGMNWANSHRADKNDATVSDELDESSNTDDTISTEFYMYLEPDPFIHDSPNTGDIGLSTNELVVIAICVGFAFIVCHRAAYSKDDRKKRKLTNA